MRDRGYSNQFICVICSLLVLSFILPCCAAAGSSVQPVQNQVVIFSGQIPFGDGNVSIRADSGTLYQVPAMTPIGIIQALAGTGMIDEYHVGDELLEKRGVFTLDGINSYKVSEYDNWYVTVNGVQLREFLLPAKEGLNTYKLADGDDILFSFGDPTLPVGAAKALIWVQIGNKNGMMQYLSPLQMPVSYQVIPTSIPTMVPVMEVPVQTPIPSVAPTVVVAPVVSTPAPTVIPTVVVTAVPTPVPTENQSVAVGVVSTPAPTVIPTVVVTAVPTPVPTENQSVAVGVVSTPAPTVVPTVVVTAVPTPVPTENIVSTPEPTVVATVEITTIPTPEPTLEPVVNETAFTTQNITETGDSELVNNTTSIEVENTTSVSGDNGELYSGVYSLPQGTVNITANSGVEYEIPANTPLGLLHLLYTNKVIHNISIDDRGMRKGKILILDGINEYFSTASKVWYVRVNGNTLEDYEDLSEGLNIFSLASGDDVSFYYGDPEEPFQDSDAMMFVTIE